MEKEKTKIRIKLLIVLVYTILFLMPFQMQVANNYLSQNENYVEKVNNGEINIDSHEEMMKYQDAQELINKPDSYRLKIVLINLAIVIVFYIGNYKKNGKKENGRQN